MSTYKFVMHDYHAVKEADIEIAGLTVVGGVNGCGKSTLARWLNYVVNILNDYDRYVIEDARRSYDELSHILSRAMNITISLRMEWMREERKFVQSDDIEEVRESFKFLSDRFANIFLKLRPQIWNLNRRRLSSLFDLEVIDNESLSDFVTRVVDHIITEGEKIYKIAVSRLDSHTFNNWKEILFDRIDLSIDDSKINLHFTEDGVTLLGGKDFSVPLMLHNAVYINTQEISSAFESSRQGYGDLWQLLQKKSDQGSPKNRSLARMIQKIIGGDVVVDTRNNLFSDRRDKLHYVRHDGLDILLRGAATGIISFSILMQLLENGWITENTLLIIDEPEAHLHPQWIVEYARVLVKINKILGTKIFVSTHNPDMLAALQSISEKEGIMPETFFYLAERFENSDKYIYKNLGQDISPIFDSFNIALERIEMYGASKSSLDFD